MMPIPESMPRINGPSASQVGSINNLGQQPVVNSRWSKACDWVKGHKKELLLASLALIVGVAFICIGWQILAVTAVPSIIYLLGLESLLLGILFTSTPIIYSIRKVFKDLVLNPPKN